MKHLIIGILAAAAAAAIYYHLWGEYKPSGPTPSAPTTFEGTHGKGPTPVQKIPTH